eukprot:1155211-Pelagomonas_calceolata.AAC.3
MLSVICTSFICVWQVAKSGILFRSAPLTTPPTEGEACGRFGAALLYDWRNNRLDVVYPDATVHSMSAVSVGWRTAVRSECRLAPALAVQAWLKM